MSTRRTELFRLPAALDAQQVNAIVDQYCSLIVENALAAPIFIKFGNGVPGPGNYDLVCPGQGKMTHPIQGVGAISAVVAYPGAVPAGDAGFYAIFTVIDRDMGATVGPLS